jgi:carbon-monoxide dehydrogenase small subunit
MADGAEFTCEVNGELQSLASWRGTRLLDYLRRGLSLTGTKEGCSEGECGACTVLIDGRPVCSCLVVTDTVCGRSVTTVENVDSDFVSRLSEAVEAAGGVQCGFCTPGFTVMAKWISEQPSMPDVSAALEGNLCRCTGYAQLVQAIGTTVERTAEPGAHGH